MFEFLNEAELLLKAFWYTALLASFIFIIQTVLTFIGGTDMDGGDADFDSSMDNDSTPFQLFSLRNLINFMLGFGWTGITFYNKISSTTLLIIVSTLVGIGFVLLFFFIIKQILKLTEDNTLKMSDLIGKVGKVYIPVPENLSGIGKIQISVKGSVHELDAMTEEMEKIPTGTSIQVSGLKENVLLVNRLNS